MKDKNRLTNPKASFFIFFGLFIIGVSIVLLTIFNYDWSDPSILNYILYNSVALLISGLFAMLGLMGFFGGLIEMMIKPKEEIIYLKEKSSTGLIFLDKKGNNHIFLTSISQDVYNVGTCYIALKTPSYIYQIINPSSEEIEIKSFKESYWLNCYLPGKQYKNIFLLPIIYIIGIIGLLLTFIGGQLQAIGLTITALYFIIFDYKIKKNKY